MTREERIALTLPVARAVIIAVNDKKYHTKNITKRGKWLAIMSLIANNICKFIDESEV